MIYWYSGISKNRILDRLEELISEIKGGKTNGSGKRGVSNCWKDFVTVNFTE